MKHLYLEDLAGLTQEAVYKHISVNYEVPLKEVKKYQILVAYESVGSWGSDSSEGLDNSSWLLLRDKENGKLYENHANHCSCYGFHGQFEPEEVTVDYLQSTKFFFNCGDADDNEEFNQAQVKAYLAELKEITK